MTIADKTLGIEVEFAGDRYAVGRHMQNELRGTGIDVEIEGYNHVTRRHWKIVSDATCGGELVSPPLSGDEMMRQLPIVLAAMHSFPNTDYTASTHDQVRTGWTRPGLSVNCGVHVHVSWDGMTADHVKNILQRYNDFERTIDSWMPESRRGNRNTWCATTDRLVAEVCNPSLTTLSRLASAASSRYHKVNVQPLNRYGTVEFRQHGATTDFTKLKNWMMFLGSFIDASRTPPTGGPNLQYRRARKIAFAEIREQVASQGWTLRFANTGYKLVDPNGDVAEFLPMAKLETFYHSIPTEWNKAYAAPHLTQEFAYWFASYFGGGTPDEVWNNVPDGVRTYLENRIATLA